MGTTAQKLEYLGTTKSQLKDMINYGLDENKITSSTTFRNYVSSIKEAFLEALRTPDTLFTNLPKKSGTGANITLNDTANAPMRITLQPSELSQSGTPTPSSPQEVHTISGSNKVVVCKKNLFTIKNYSKSGWNITIDNPLKGMTAGTYSISAVNNYITSGKGIAIYNSNTANAGINDRIGTLLTNYDFGNTTLKYENRSLTQEQLDSKYMIIAPTDNACTEEVLNNMKIMIEKGSTSTTYEPYISQEAEIDLGVENLYDFRNYKLGSQSMMSRTELSDGSYLFMSTGSGYAFAQYNLSLPAGTYSYKIETDTGANYTVLNGQNSVSNPFTLNETTTIGFRVYISNAVSGSKVILKNIILEKGTKIQEPSENPIEYGKITDNYKNEFIRTSGKNLFDGTTSATDKRISTSGTGTYTQAGYSVSNFVEIKPSTNYTLTSGTTSYFCYYDSSKTYISGTTWTNGTSKTTPNNAYYIKFDFETNANVMFNEGSTALDYEPYGNGTWYIKKNIGKVVLDGSEEGWASTSSATGYYRFTTNQAITNRANNYYGINNRFIQRTTQAHGTYEYLYFDSASQYIYIQIETSRLGGNTANDFKTWLSNNNTTLYYVLATPTYTQITGTLETQLENVYQKLLSYSGTTNISQINNDLPFILNVSAIEV